MPPAGRSNVANDLAGMGIFEERYFNINRRLLMCLGLWPFEDNRKKHVLQAIIIGTLVIMTTPQLSSINMHYEKMNRLMLSVFCFFSLIFIVLKMIGIISAEENIKELYRSIANNWQRIQDRRERDILRIYSERVRNIIVYYIAGMLASAMFVSSLPLIPKILDFVWPLENPRPDMHLSQGEFFIDRETYFLLCFVLEYSAVLLMALIMITIDTMYILSVEHCCAMYSIIRYRLLVLRPIVQESSSESEGVESYEWLLQTIQLYHDTLTFTSLLNDSYSTTFLFVLVGALIAIPLDACAILANLDNPLHLFPYAICLLALTIHGFFLFYPGQRIINHQLSILDAAYYNEWYAAPLRTRKLLLIFMLRCSKPATITSGNLLPINFEVFCQIMVTSFSYITVAASFVEGENRFGRY